MPEAKKRPERFTQKYVDAYPREIQYRRLSDNLQGSSTRNFQLAREKQMGELLAEGDEKVGMSHALLSEFVVDLAINPLISPHGYRVNMAAQSIEGGGKDQRGVDLLIVDRQQKIMMGIDVKLRKKKSVENRNGGAWLGNLAAPFINLTLGNWPVEVKDESVGNVKQWLVKCALPNIAGGGKIPGLNSLRSFAVTRIKNSLEHQLARLDNNQPVTTTNLPLNRQERVACRQKLKGLIEVFGRVEGEIKNR